MKGLAQILAWFIPVLMLAAPACERKATDELPNILLDNPNLELLEDVEILYSDSAFVKVRVRGPVMLYHTERNDPRQEFIEGIEVEFLDRNMEVLSRLTAKFAIRRESLGIIIVRDSVVWKSNQNEQLTTDEMTWDERRQKVFTDRFVVITRPEEILYGRGFEADQDFTNITMKAVEGRVKVDNQGDKQDEN
jgi:LPS export ABC transporter protein LptC